MARFVDPTKTETIGSIKLWTRPNLTKDLPTNWVIADGSTIADPDSPFDGTTVPNLVDRFPQGDPSINNSSGLGSYQSSSVVTGGPSNHTRNFSHDHNVDSHSHTVNSHSHSISTDGSHTHDSVAGPTQFNNASALAGTTSEGAHNHGGSTGSDNPGTSSSSPNTDNSLGNVDMRPKFIRLVYIVKIK